ncbi:MAG TPA: methyltransferase domain-containing protein [Flavobacterium sp.]|nr:methyltransferase domain-containing protein [Flavobacterium sp.]
MNKFNLLADKKVYGRWKELNAEYFSDPKTIEALYELFANSKTALPKDCGVVEFGSAEGMVGEYFKDMLSVNHRVSLTIVDAIAEHVHANENPETEKIVADLLNYSEKERFDLAIARSLLHYFSIEEQKTVLKNIFNSLKSGGYFLVQAFIQKDEDLDLFLKLNRFVGKELQLVPITKLINQLEEVGFKVVPLGDAPTWRCSSENLQNRYDLSNDELITMRNMIIQTANKSRRGFDVTDSGFTVPIPFQVLMAKKP